MPARCGTEDLAALRRLARELGMPVSTLIRVGCRSYLREKTGEVDVMRAHREKWAA
jgi:hypothetical protein